MAQAGPCELGGPAWNAGVLECWSNGVPITPPLHYSITPPLRHSIPPGPANFHGVRCPELTGRVPPTMSARRYKPTGASRRRASARARQGFTACPGKAATRLEADMRVEHGRDPRPEMQRSGLQARRATTGRNRYGDPTSFGRPGGGGVIGVTCARGDFGTVSVPTFCDDCCLPR